MGRARVRAGAIGTALWAGLLVGALTCAGAGCTRGKKKADGTASSGQATEAPGQRDQAAPGDQADKGDKGADGMDPLWLKGDLPKSVTEGTPKQGGEVIVQIWSEPPSLCTAIDSDWLATYVIDHQVTESLVRIDPYDDPGYAPKPSLAERWEISDDKRVYTFHLRQGVKWHDGKPFSAKDVIATFDKITDPSTKSHHVRSFLENLAKYEAVDASTVRFTWKKPYFMVMDVMHDIVIMPAHLIGPMSAQAFNEAATNPQLRAPMGTGPFKFAEWATNQKIVIERNDDYWGDKAHLDRVIFRIVKDATVRKQMAERQEVDVWSRPLDGMWREMNDEPVFVEHYNRSLIYDASYAWIGWNQKSKPFLADKRVRRALTQLLDRTRMAETIFFGLKRPTACHFYWASPECEGLKPLPYDPEGAEKLLDEAGWKDSDGDGVRDKDGVPFRFTFMLPASSENSAKIATKMKEDYYKAGIDVQIQKLEWGTYHKRLLKHEFDACTLMWGGGPRGDPRQIWHSGSVGGGSNYVHFSNAEADKLIEEAAVELDTDKRTRMYRRLGEILIEEQPYTFLYNAASLALLHKRVKGARESLFWWQFQDWWVEGPR